MKVLLTGGAGYIGTHTALSLIENGHEVCIVDNYTNSNPEAVRRVEALTKTPIRSYEFDVRDEKKLQEVLSVHKPDCVIHLAGLKSVSESVDMPIEYYKNNIDSTLVLLETMKKTGVSNLVFSSSATVYGEDNTPPLSEDMQKGRCTNPYGWSKWMQEEIIADTVHASKKNSIKRSESVNCIDDSPKEYALSAVILRYFNPVGAHESGMIGEAPSGVPNNLMPYISQVASGQREQLTVFGNDYDTPDGTCRRDYIHVMDLAFGHVKAAEYLVSKKGIHLFNLGTGTPCSVIEMIKAFEKACGQPIKYVIGSRRVGDVQDSWADASKAEKILGWKASKNIDDMCIDAWRWQKQNTKGYEKI